jgi:hypothetical protein
MIEGRARLRDADILYRSALYPLSGDGIAIDHVLGTANYRPTRKRSSDNAPHSDEMALTRGRFRRYRVAEAAAGALDAHSARYLTVFLTRDTVAH